MSDLMKPTTQSKKSTNEDTRFQPVDNTVHLPHFKSFPYTFLRPLIGPFVATCDRRSESTAIILGGSKQPDSTTWLIASSRGTSRTMSRVNSNAHAMGLTWFRKELINPTSESVRSTCRIHNKVLKYKFFPLIGRHVLINPDADVRPATRICRIEGISTILRAT